MFRQPKFNGQKLKATSGRGNGTNYVTPSGERVKLSDRRMARVQDSDDSAHVKEDHDFMVTPMRELQWLGSPANRDNRPTNRDNRTDGPRPANGGKSFK